MRLPTSSLSSLLALGLTLAAVPGSVAGEGSVRDTTTVVAVEVPVHVLRDGEPVRGLTRDDFEILDGKKRQKITGFEVVDLSRIGAVPGPADSPGTSQPARVPLSARRHFLVLFDLSFSDPTSVVRARDAARELVDGALHPTDLVAVGVYTASKGPQLLHGFTSDRRQALLAIETLGAPQLFQPVRDPLGLIFGDLEDAAKDTGGAEGPGGGAASEVLGDFVRMLEQQDRRNEEQRIRALSRSLADLGKLMRNVPGRKHVLYLSEGFDTASLFGTADRGTQNRINEAAQEGRYWEVDSEERFGSTRGQTVLEEMFEEFRRADCTIQTVDIGGLRTDSDVQHGSRAAREGSRASLVTRDDSLALMARATGGDFLRNFNDLSEAMDRVLERTGVTYVLTFEPRDVALDGAYHKLKVRLKKGSSGARIVHRAGYFAPRPFAAASAEERRLATAGLVVGGQEGGGIEMAVLALSMPPIRGTDAYVPIVVEIDGPSLVGDAAGGTVGAEIYAYALAGDGRIRDFLSHSLAIDLSKAGPQLTSVGLKFFGHLDLPAGSYELRTFVRNSHSGAYGLHSAPLVVPDLGFGEPAVSPPLFPETPGRFLMLREELGAGEEPPFPFLAGGQPYIPGLKPELAGGAEAAVHLVAFGLGEGDAEVTSRVLDASGTVVQGLALERVQRADGPEGRVELSAVLAVQDLEPGEYRLEVTVSNPWTGLEASRSAPFAVR